MTSPRTPLLDLDVCAAVEQIADGELKRAAKALARLRNPRDRTALHNFRVAIRRLHSLLRTYRPWIGRAGGKKPRRRLKALTRLTGFSRDAEVQIEWLQAQRPDLERGERAGLDWLLRRLRARKRDHDRIVRKRLSKDFERLEKSLRNRLGAMGASDSKDFRVVFGDLLEERARRFFELLAGIANVDDHEPIHKARISAKRLRYVVEPLRRSLPEARAVVGEMKRVQDLLGQLHDTHVLESALEAAVEEAAIEKARRLHGLAVGGDKAALAREQRRDEQLGLAELAMRARRKRDVLFGKLQSQWMADRKPELSARIGALRAVCQPSAAVEIERKYLLRSLPPGARSAPAEEIEQGWLPGERLRERLRRVSNGDGEKYFRTVKFGAGIQRVELEEPTTAGLFRALWPLTAGCRVRKRRYRVADGELTWEIDQFLDRDLVLAEVELPDPATPVTMPGWLERYAVREVTDDPEFVNLNLAR